MKHRFTLLFALLCASIMGFAVDQDTWIEGNVNYANQFKWYAIEGVDTPDNVVNIQKPGFATEIGIYMTFPSADFNAVYMNDVLATNEIEYKQDGAGIVVYISALTSKNTEIIIKQGETIRWGLKVYNAKGEGVDEGGSEGGEPEPEPGVINWSSISWLGNGSGNAAYTDKIKVAAAEGQTVVNLQQPAWAAEAGIYTHFPAGIQSCSLPEGKYAINGAGICLYLTAFTAKETEVTIVDATKTYVFTVYYEDGQEGEGGGEGTDPTPKPEPTLGTFTINSVWPEDRVTASMDGEDIKVNIASFGNGQWNAQLKINHNISFVNTKSYKIAFTLTSDKDCGGITLKTDDNHGEVYENQSINLTANTPFYYEKVFSGTPDNNKITVFDFGWVGENTNITISDLTLIEYSPATASSANGEHIPFKAVDGNMGSRWQAASVGEAWWKMDYGTSQKFNRVNITWETSYAKSFSIQGSNDDENYTTIKTITGQNIDNPNNFKQVIDLDQLYDYQYVKFVGTENANGYGFSFYEFEVMEVATSVLTDIVITSPKFKTTCAIGNSIDIAATARDQYELPMPDQIIGWSVSPADKGTIDANGHYTAQIEGEVTITANCAGKEASIVVVNTISENLALNKPATAGANETPVAEANDASLTSYWSLGPNKNEDEMWWRVDLEETYDLSLVIIKWEGACPTEHAIQVSTDDTNWTDAATLSGLPEIGTETDHKYQFYSMSNAARYIRVKASALRDKGWGMKIYDFQAFGTLAATLTKPVSARVNDAAMGTATVKKGGEDVTEVETGSEVTFSAVANDGYIFVEWSNGEKNATFTTTVDAALNLTATVRKLGTTYCNTLVQSTNGGQEHDAYVTMKRTAENEYTLVVRSTEKLKTFGGTVFYMYDNILVQDLRNLGTLSNNGHTLTATLTATNEPYMTTPLYVVLDGGFEAHFPRLTDIEFAVSCEDPEITAMVLNHSTAVLETGNTITLEPIFTPAFMSADITWETSNADVATVSNGIVTAIGAGEATITAKVSETIKATCIITVQTATAHNWYGYATDQELDYTYRIEYTIDHHIVAHVKRQGEKVGLVDASMLIGDKWTVINNTEGEEEGWKKGVTEQTYTIGEELNILIQSNYAGEPSKVYINYIVGSDNTMPTIEPSQLSLNTNSLTLGVSDEDIQLVAEIHHCDAANKTLTWTSSNEAAVTVVDGKVHPVAVGTATITATTHNGISANCEVTVVGALEAATWYGVTTIQVNENPVGVNYSITRTSERKLQFYYSLAESIEELGNTSVVFKGAPETWNTMMKLDANERTAEFTSESTYIDGSTIGIYFYLEFAGGAGRWDVDYIVGSSNEKPNTLVAFGDQADNTAKIAEYADEVVDAYINRTFPNTDEWYTLCLPFEMDEAQLAATFGAGYTLATLGNSEDRGSLIHLNFNYVNTLEAGKPYLLRPGVSTATVPMIEDVTIKNVDPSAAPQKAESAHMHFQGTFAPTTLEGDNKRFVGPNNYLYSPAEGGTNMKSFRCYFTIPVESQALVGSKAARIVLGPQVATGMENVQSDEVPSTKVMIDGTLYIIRGERTYNAQRQLVK